MAVQGVEDVYASLLLTDTYLPGALVLAHSLRDAGTTKKLAILVTLDTVSVDVLTQLKAVYDYVIPVGRIQNEHPANLDLMNRPDLHSAFTKINLWRQTQFRKIVYVDADIVAYRAPDELFDLPHAFSAAPDIGWPDLFNTGLMVLAPNMGDYYALLAMAQRGISFDGADQGLLNMYFKNSFNRLSFSYNVTPSAHYQYVPAYQHFQSSINMVHFIGPEKPWIQGREKATGSLPFHQMFGRWWAVYDRHYRKETELSHPEQQVPEIVQYFVKGEYQPTVRYVVPVGEPPSDQSGNFYGQQYQPAPPPSHVDMQYPQQQHHSHQSYPLPEQHPHHPHQHHDHQHSHQQHDHHHHHHHHQHHHESHQHSHHPHSQPPLHSTEPSSHSASHPSVSSGLQGGTHTEARKDQASDHQQWGSQPPSQSEQKPEPQPQPDMKPSWDAQRQPPPPDSKPEAMNFPQTHYAMSSDPAPFVPPERYPSPPKNMWYEVPKQPPANPKEKPKPLFPWETNQPRPTRVFAHPFEPEPEPEPPAAAEPVPAASGGDNTPWTGSQTQIEPTPSGGPAAQTSEPPHTPPAGPASRTALSAAPATMVDIWSSFPRTNAWDNVPEINRYVDRTLQKHRRTRSRNLALAGNGNAKSAGGGGDEGAPEFGFFTPRRGSKVTDFPSEDDRPSLPVTPAPIRRPRGGRRVAGGGRPGEDDGYFNYGEGGGEQLLTGAEGVPGQADWDPAAQLRKLAKEQSELLFQRLGGGGGGGEGDDGHREEEQQRREIPSRPLPFGSEDARSPTYVAPVGPPVVSPKPVKPHTGASPVNRILAAAPEIMRSQEPATTTATATVSQGPVNPISPPSYQGPGPAFEKGEDIPTFETPALPTEEERDVLET
ncbi:Glycogenin-1 [Parachaetomium inaequale]|uniref:glycogenin glucosyltransferase n=1 Tax=Parachaetomium inaequale TaxID=2588326 RepID=A0AAN6STU8_9PEZI|nr:Glycogenin-1 [Parachaetomium inaequale]